MALEFKRIDSGLRTAVPDTAAKTASVEQKEAAGTKAAGKSEENGLQEAAKESTAANTDRDVYVRSSKAETGESVRDSSKMTAEQRTALVDSLKAQQAEQEKEFLNMIRNALGDQAKNFLKANATLSMDNDGMWHFLAEGNFTVDLETKTKAEKAISEDGEYGIKKTSERLFQFAEALAGDDEEKMRKMQSAMQEGYAQATASWGKELPEICKNTIDATEKLFEDYYKKKSGAEAVTT